MRSKLMYALLLFLCACTTAPLDSGEDQCLEVCTSEFKVQLEGTPEEFQIQLYGEDFMTLNLACPVGISAGGPGFAVAECIDGGFLIRATDYVFPDSMTISVDSGPEQVLEPDWQESAVCGSVCTSAEVSL